MAKARTYKATMPDGRIEKRKSKSAKLFYTHAVIFYEVYDDSKFLPGNPVAVPIYPADASKTYHVRTWHTSLELALKAKAVAEAKYERWLNRPFDKREKQVYDYNFKIVPVEQVA